MYKGDKFDLMVRSMMEKGEETVPAGLWEGICERMDAAEGIPAAGSRRRFAPWMWRTAVGFAAAAALVAGVFIFKPQAGTGASEMMVAKAFDAQPVQLEDTVDMPAEIPATDCVETRDAVIVETRDAVIVETRNEITRESTGTAAEDSRNTTIEEAQPQEAKSFEPQEPIIVRKNYGSRLASIQLTGGGNAGSNTGSTPRGMSRMSVIGITGITGESLVESESTYYGLPITFGVGARFNFDSHWSVSAGLRYTFLDRRFDGKYKNGAIESFTQSIANTQHYIGIPVHVYYNFLSTDRVKLYAFAGGAAEKNIADKYSFNYNGAPKILKQKVKGLQWSVSAGAGIEVAVTDFLGLYLDPSYNYFIPAEKQPKSIRTSQPSQINCEIGLRFNL